MNAQTLLANFDTLANAAGGVASIRALLLDLAVTGRLVPQSSSDEPAFKMLADRGVDPDELQVGAPGLPPGWCSTALRALGDVKGGGTPSKRNSAFWGGDIPWVSPKDMKRLRIGESIDAITEAAVEGSSVKLIPPGSLLMVTRGMILAHSFPVAVTTREVTVNQDMKALIPLDGVAEYLLVALQAARFRVLDLVERSTHGTCRLSTDAVFDLEVWVPPLAEQRRIVAKVDELMALCDELEEKQNERRTIRVAARTSCLDALTSAQTPDDLARAWTRVKAHWPDLTSHPDDIPPLRDALIELAITGRLTNQDPQEPSAEEHLQALNAERSRLVAAKRIRKTKCKKLPRPELALPSGWSWAQLQDLFAMVTDGDHQAPPRAEEGIPFLVISNVRWGALQFEGSRRVPASYYESLDWTRQPTEGDILYTVVGSFGIPVLVDVPTKFCVQRHVAILKGGAETCSAYWARALSSPLVYRQATNVATGTAQKTVPLSGLRGIWVPVPPLAEQHRILDRLDEFTSLCATLEQAVQEKAELAGRFAAAAASR